LRRIRLRLSAGGDSVSRRLLTAEPWTRFAAGAAGQRFSGEHGSWRPARRRDRRRRSPRDPTARSTNDDARVDTHDVRTDCTQTGCYVGTSPPTDITHRPARGVDGTAPAGVRTRELGLRTEGRHGNPGLLGRCHDRGSRASCCRHLPDSHPASSVGPRSPTESRGGGATAVIRTASAAVLGLSPQTTTANSPVTGTLPRDPLSRDNVGMGGRRSGPRSRVAPHVRLRNHGRAFSTVLFSR
jgi:hypothetical protein